MLSSFNNDPARIYKSLDESMFSGQYYLNVPGVGIDKTPFQEDPHIHLQKWGANIRTETTNLESDLLGLTRNYHKGDVDEYTVSQVKSQRVAFPSADPFVEQSRASHPAFLLRDMETTQYQWDYPILNPQDMKRLEHQQPIELQTRLLERDFKKAPPTDLATFYPLLPLSR